MRSILLHIHDDPCLEARLQAALDLARAFDAHVTCLQVTPFAYLVPGDLYGTLAAEMVPVLTRQAGELRDSVCARLQGEDVAWDWRQEDGLAFDFLLQASGLSDLVVVGACDPFERGNGPSRLAGALAVRGRTPVLVVPQSSGPLDPGAPAVIAWNGSLEAAHALTSALPLLAKATSVTLAFVQEDPEVQGRIPPDEGARYLSRHGIACELIELPLTGSVAQVLEGAAAARDASFLVMGAYGHPRFVETVFGGVTRELLAQPPLPILLAH